MSTITAGDKWEANVFYLLYWLPNPLQFGSFLILPLFYSQVTFFRDISGTATYFVGSTLFR